jgi:hypothetical protein
MYVAMYTAVLILLHFASVQNPFHKSSQAQDIVAVSVRFTIDSVLSVPLDSAPSPIIK